MYTRGLEKPLHSLRERSLVKKVLPAPLPLVAAKNQGACCFGQPHAVGLSKKHGPRSASNLPLSWVQGELALLP